MRTIGTMLLAACVAVAWGGPASARGQRVGMRIGLTHSEASGDWASTGLDEPDLGLFLGAFGEQSVGYNVRVRVEGLLSQWNLDGDNMSAETLWLDIPVTARMNLGEVWAYAGLNVALNLDASGSANWFWQGTVDGMMDNIENISAGLVIGFDYEFRSSRNLMSADLRYAVGLTDIDSRDNPEAQIDVLSLGLTIHF